LKTGSTGLPLASTEWETSLVTNTLLLAEMSNFQLQVREGNQGNFKKIRENKTNTAGITTEGRELQIGEKISAKASIKTELRYYVFINFEFGDNTIILFKLKEVFLKFFTFSFQIVID
jgi:hypothetical protein